MRLDAQNLDILQMLLSEGRISKKELAERVTLLPIPWVGVQTGWLHWQDPRGKSFSTVGSG